MMYSVSLSAKFEGLFWNMTNVFLIFAVLFVMFLCQDILTAWNILFIWKLDVVISNEMYIVET